MQNCDICKLNVKKYDAHTITELHKSNIARLANGLEPITKEKKKAINKELRKEYQKNYIKNYNAKMKTETKLCEVCNKQIKYNAMPSHLKSVEHKNNINILFIFSLKYYTLPIFFNKYG